MKRDRVSDNVVVFTSMQYAQVTAGAVLTPEGAVLIDTLPFPDETREIIDYLKTEGPRGVVRYVVNTHRHGDHTHGNYLFPQAEIIGHRLCRETLLKWGRESLDQAKEATPQLAEVELRVPDITFEREMSIYLGGATLDMLYLPGPNFLWGDREQLIRSMETIRAIELEHIVQGHGDVLLRGEIDETIDQSIGYLDNIYQKVKKRVEAGGSERDLLKITVEKSGGSPIAMDGMARQLHHANLVKLFRTLSEEKAKEQSKTKTRKPRTRRKEPEAES
jgi:cyclase